jgi:hypothetical protein
MNRQAFRFIYEFTVYWDQKSYLKEAAPGKQESTFNSDHSDDFERLPPQQKALINAIASNNTTRIEKALNEVEILASPARKSKPNELPPAHNLHTAVTATGCRLAHRGPPPR